MEAVVAAYRQTARAILRRKWRLLLETGRLDKNAQVKPIVSPLSERYKQTVQYQMVALLKGWLGNRQNDFINLVRGADLDAATRMQLCYINKYQKWFCREVRMQGKPLPAEVLKLARQIIKRTFRRHRLPDVRHIQLHLDQKVAKVLPKAPDKASYFDYWIKLATLDKGKPIFIPLKSNPYFDAVEGPLKQFCQIHLKDGGIQVYLLKDVPVRDYHPKVEQIALDVGLNCLFATDRGDLLGRNFLDRLIGYDKVLTELARNRQRQGLRLRDSKRYVRLTEKLRQWLKNEVNRLLNHVVAQYRPRQIVLERLDFRSPKLSRRMNRLVSRFGKRYIREKPQSLEALYGIETVWVNPAYTSRTCSACGYVDPRNRKSQAALTCAFCGRKQHADVNAARNIRQRSSWPNGGIYLSQKTLLKALLAQFLERWGERRRSDRSESSPRCRSPAAKRRDCLNANPYFCRVGLDPTALA
ncbi:transposase [Methylomarinovum caldicuralii]|uniref:Transposase n=1 Tax=Methylomarinovum caldicuralii TaxID=438856 RepID=A0AAU9CXS7_9GAMM|nr:transposase [Methylomarinovum caldicuralii]BCX82792.1 transposase [Methylomarinovum caldicuralii]